MNMNIESYQFNEIIQRSSWMTCLSVGLFYHPVYMESYSRILMEYQHIILSSMTWPIMEISNSMTIIHHSRMWITANLIARIIRFHLRVYLPMTNCKGSGQIQQLNKSEISKNSSWKYYHIRKYWGTSLKIKTTSKIGIFKIGWQHDIANQCLFGFLHDDGK